MPHVVVEPSTFKYNPTQEYMSCVILMDKKIVFSSRFFGEKSVFGWVGNDFGKEKTKVKKIGEKSPIFQKKTDFS